MRWLNLVLLFLLLMAGRAWSITNTPTTTPTPTPTNTPAACGTYKTGLAPVFWWRVDETSGANAADNTGNGFTGVYQPSPPTAPLLAQVGATVDGDYAISLPASPINYVALNDSTDSRLNTADWSAAVWIKTTSGSQMQLYQQYNTSTLLTRTGMKVDAGVFYCGVGIGTNCLATQSIEWWSAFGGNLSDNLYHHVACSFNGTTKLLSIYVDGALRNSHTFTQGLCTLASPQRILFGSNDPSTPNPNQTEFVGSLDELQIYNRVVSAGDISNEARICMGSPTLTPTNTFTPTNTPTRTPTATSALPTSTPTATPAVCGNYKSMLAPYPWYRFGRSVNVVDGFDTDASGNGITGTFQGLPTFNQPGATLDGDTAVKFNTTGNDWFQIADASPARFNAANWSFAAWLKVDPSMVAEAVVEVHDHATGNPFPNQDLARTGVGMIFFSGSEHVFCSANIVQGCAGTASTDFIEIANVERATIPIGINDGAWHHIACVFDASLAPFVWTLKAYQDGALQASRNVGAGLCTLPTPNYIAVGRDFGNNGVPFDPFKGQIDEPQWYDRALSPGEISNEANICAGSPTMTPTVTLTPTVTNTPTVTPTFTNTGGTNTPTPTKTATPTPSVCRNAKLALTPVAWFRLNELSGTVATDSSGNSHTGTYTGPPTLNVAGATIDGDRAITLISSHPDYMSFDASASALHPSSFSAALWFKTTPGGGRMVFFEQTDPTTHFSRIGADFDGGSTGDTYCYVNLTSNCNAGTASSLDYLNNLQRIQTNSLHLNDSTYHHLACTFDGATNTLRMFIDGVQQAAQVFGSGLCPMASSTMYVGSDPTLRNGWTGQLDEPQFYDRALTGAELLNEVDLCTGLATPTPTQSFTPSITPTRVPSLTPTKTATSTPINTLTPTQTNTVGATTPTVTPKPTNTPILVTACCQCMPVPNLNTCANGVSCPDTCTAISAAVCGSDGFCATYTPTPVATMKPSKVFAVPRVGTLSPGESRFSKDPGDTFAIACSFFRKMTHDERITTKSISVAALGAMTQQLACPLPALVIGSSWVDEQRIVLVVTDGQASISCSYQIDMYATTSSGAQYTCSLRMDVSHPTL